MINQQRIAVIKEKLTQAFHPKKLSVTDESRHHIGHSGAQDGHGHFSIEIEAEYFRNRTLMECHRLIYQALAELMQTDIHALRIRAKAPND